MATTHRPRHSRDVTTGSTSHPVTSTLHADPAKSRPSHTSSLAQPHQLAGPATPARWSSHTSSLDLVTM
ncbi:hypothetical protein DAPPUDRAFT_248810 [Daphnia pulex]|uniref:Uncharacterized protein n=1 Tax=Daphnia pulex TaxID=6669 RepID=E9GVA1_DAPPU|nr:hypothetical protein DAPPUDRAFT_248810 [Daphnia pulex]|eukprot:EFX76624.1 hypothetical protein DAPPUDRAFT_248810 [Daphnia pulex]